MWVGKPHKLCKIFVNFPSSLYPRNRKILPVRQTSENGHSEELTPAPPQTTSSVGARRKNSGTRPRDHHRRPRCRRVNTTTVSPPKVIQVVLSSEVLSRRRGGPLP